MTADENIPVVVPLDVLLDEVTTLRAEVEAWKADAFRLARALHDTIHTPRTTTAVNATRALVDHDRLRGET